MPDTGGIDLMLVTQAHPTFYYFFHFLSPQFPANVFLVTFLNQFELQSPRQAEVCTHFQHLGQEKSGDKIKGT